MDSFVIGLMFICFFRYGVKNLIRTLVSVGLVVHWRYISNSQFCNDAYTDTDTVDSSSDSSTPPDHISTSSEGSAVRVRGCEACARHIQQRQSKTNDTSQHSPTCCDSCEQILYNHVPLLDSFRCTVEDDYLTSDLAEAPYYKWLFLIIHWQHQPTADIS